MSGNQQHTLIFSYNGSRIVAAIDRCAVHMMIHAQVRGQPACADLSATSHALVHGVNPDHIILLGVSVRSIQEEIQACAKRDGALGLAVLAFANYHGLIITVRRSVHADPTVVARLDSTQINELSEHGRSVSIFDQSWRTNFITKPSDFSTSRAVLALRSEKHATVGA